MESIDLFKHVHYRAYLRKEFPGTGEKRGRRMALAEFLRCQSSFLSQVLTDRAHLSLEHAIKTSEFLNHTDLERKYFMLLIQKEKAGTKSLETYFDSEISEIQKSRGEIKERIQINTDLLPEDQMKYYSVWYFSAIHILSAIPNLNTLEAMQRSLKLDPVTLKKALEFLVEKGFVQKVGGRYQIGSTRIHLPKGSPMLPRHHSNWRLKAMEAVDQEREGDLHYSAILGISLKDKERFRSRLLDLLQEFELIIRDSTVEEEVILLFDLFSL